MSRRRRERGLKQGIDMDNLDIATETVCKFDSFEMTGTYKYDDNNDQNNVYCLQYTWDGEYLMVGYGDGCIEMLSMTDGVPKLEKQLRQKIYGGLPITCMRFHPQLHKKVLYASTSAGVIWAVDTEDATNKKVAEEIGNEINALDFSRQGNNFITAGRDLHVRQYDTKTGQIINTWKGYDEKKGSQTPNTHGMRIFCAKYASDNNNIFFTSGWDNSVKIWDSRSGEPVKKTIVGPHVCGDSLDVMDHLLLTGSWAQHDALQIWDYRYKNLLHNLPFHVTGKDEAGKQEGGAYLYSAQFVDRETVVAGGSGTKSLQAVSVKDNKVIGEIKLHDDPVVRKTFKKGGTVEKKDRDPADRIVHCADTALGGRLVAFGGQGNILQTATLTGDSIREVTEEEKRGD